MTVILKSLSAQTQLITLHSEMANEGEQVVTALDLEESEKQEVLAELRKKKTLSLLACGQRGVGKSTLLNGLSRKDCFKESDKREILGPEETYSLTCYKTPAFTCTADNGNDNDYIKKIKEKCPEVDALMYCIKVDRTRVDIREDKTTLLLLKKALKPEVWKHCIIVLTFANRIVTRLRQKSEKNVNVAFNEAIDEWKWNVQQMLTEIGICPDNIPVAIGGSREMARLLDEPDNYWFSNLFFAVCDVLPSDGQDVFSSINSDRIRYARQVKPDVHFKGELKTQPIVQNRSRIEWIKRNYPTIAAGLGTAGVAGTTGAGIGAVVGALAIGIPSFGVFASVGLIIGGAVGGGVGVGSGILVAKAVDTVRKRKKAKDSSNWSYL